MTCLKALFTSPQKSLPPFSGLQGAGDRAFVRTNVPELHVKMLIVETAPPCEKSETIRRSPSVCVPTKVPLAVQLLFGTFPVGLPAKWKPVQMAKVESWTNQNPAVASPALLKRSMPA